MHSVSNAAPASRSASPRAGAGLSRTVGCLHRRPDALPRIRIDPWLTKDYKRLISSTRRLSCRLTSQPTGALAYVPRIPSEGMLRDRSK